MKKWSRRILIFGVTATILGTCAMMTGVATGGVNSLLALSHHAVYKETEIDEVIEEKVEKLDISMDQHEVLIRESEDDKIHVTYYNRMTGQTDFDQSVKDGVLTLSDSNEKKSRDLGAGLNVILIAYQYVTGRNSQVSIAVPKGTILKDIKVRMPNLRYTFGVVGVATEHADIETASFHNSITRTIINSGSIKTQGILYMGDGAISQLTIESEDSLTLDEVAIRKQVSVKASETLSLYLKEGEEDRTSYHLTAPNGDIGLLNTVEDYGYDYDHIQEMGEKYEFGNQNASNKLIAETDSGIEIYKP
ncbi:hypothetical protein STRDD10_01049 [Streptococcus sp. DD10]|uniref:DUF4097 family beta strand repeat-containing protein n=1 Tax=Streptococcus sp. DD10 TaxID=1777878 RepID=UPI00079C9C26|nr:DUF4097 family beta strand repeat-containing protein [Streptococcus sp. DD10]KXT74299.1 hypothetical protein STRDD10_01049 [Streptococcus sp. DD10]